MTDLTGRHWRAGLGATCIAISLIVFLFTHVIARGEFGWPEEFAMHALLIGAGYALIDKDSFKELLSKLVFWKGGQ